MYIQILIYFKTLLLKPYCYFTLARNFDLTKSEKMLRDVSNCSQYKLKGQLNYYPFFILHKLVVKLAKRKQSGLDTR